MSDARDPSGPHDRRLERFVANRRREAIVVVAGLVALFVAGLAMLALAGAVWKSSSAVDKSTSTVERLTKSAKVGSVTDRCHAEALAALSETLATVLETPIAERAPTAPLQELADTIRECEAEALAGAKAARAQDR